MTDGIVELDAAGLIVSDAAILGGHPIIKGTRLLANTVRKRIDAGDTFEMLEHELPMVDQAAFRAAYEYASENPPPPRERAPWHPLPSRSMNSFGPREQER